MLRCESPFVAHFHRSASVRFRGITVFAGRLALGQQRESTQVAKNGEASGMLRSAVGVLCGLLAAASGLMVLTTRAAHAQQELVYGSQVPAADYLNSHALP